MKFSYLELAYVKDKVISSKKLDKLVYAGGRYTLMQNHFFLEIVNSENIASIEFNS